MLRGRAEGPGCGRGAAPLPSLPARVLVEVAGCEGAGHPLRIRPLVPGSAPTQARAAADQASLEARQGRMEREALKFKVGPCTDWSLPMVSSEGHPATLRR